MEQRGKMEPVRLNKFLSEVGVCSRREADRLVEEGQILVNGKPAENGMRVTERDHILVRGVEISGENISGEKAERVVLAVNKPRGVVCTTATFPGEKNIVELVNYPTRLYPVGRLDKTSEGLVLMTNYGELVNHVLRARNDHEKEYVVSVDKPLTEEMLDAMRRGIPLKELGVTTKPCKVRQTSEYVFHIVLTQGLNRQIRRMCEYLGLHVRRLKRVRIMGIQLGDIPLGGYRRLSESEIRALMGETVKKTPKWHISDRLQRGEERSK